MDSVRGFYHTLDEKDALSSAVTGTNFGHNSPDSKVHGAYMGPTWGRQYPGVGHMIPAIWECLYVSWKLTTTFHQQKPCCWRRNVMITFFAYWYLFLHAICHLSWPAGSREICKYFVGKFSGIRLLSCPSSLGMSSKLSIKSSKDLN